MQLIGKVGRSRQKQKRKAMFGGAFLENQINIPGQPSESGSSKQVDLIGTPFYVMKKERADWTYSDELEDRIQDIDADKKKEQRKGVAINEPTEYTSVGHH